MKQVEVKGNEVNVVFTVAKLENGHLAYNADDLDTKDALTLLAMVVKYVKEVAAKEIGLTEEEADENIAKAVQIGAGVKASD